MKVSVIIPAYDAQDTIAETLDSVSAQTSPDWEAVVVDDGSKDDTAEVVEDFARREKRIRLIRQPNGGEAAARNSGIQAARYDWLLFLDADDWIAPSYLERMTRELAADPDLDAVHCGWARAAADGTLIAERYQPPAGDMFSVWARRSAFPVHACIVRKSLVVAVGGFDTSFRKSTDWDLWQRIARTGARFGAVREVLAYYRMRPEAASLEARELLRDGLRVIRQGHAPDPRVSRPHPAHARGLPAEQVSTQVYYLVSWCAGLLLGRGRDATRLFDDFTEQPFLDLYPDAVAQCVFEAAPLPLCASPALWERLWPAIEERVLEFLTVLEEKAQAPDLARRAHAALLRMVLKHSPTWRPAIEDLEQANANLEQWRSDWEGLARDREQLLVEQARRIEELQATQAALSETVRHLSGERDQLWNSRERRFGDLLLNRIGLRKILSIYYALGQRLIVSRLGLERRMESRRRRIVATICTNFPIYSQTFVYQELSHLMQEGFTLRLVYSRLDSRDQLPVRFAPLWRSRRRLFLDRRIHRRDYARYRRRMPDKVEALVDRLCRASGMPREELVGHGNFLQAFSFTRMVEAYRPDYLHSYFFYDRSLMALVAAYLLDIPRGISCYADHMLNDYELKVVPLHLELCDVVVATSERIKRELLKIAPGSDPERIIVKPNGIDADSFPMQDRSAPMNGQPFRLVSVSRIEPKKGLIDLVEAVHLLRGRGVRVEAHVIGAADEWSTASREYKRRLDQRIGELGLWGSVHLEGRQDLTGILRFHRLAHLFVAPYVETESGDKDGIPTAVLEAMATGLPVVATDAGSMTEVIENERDGVLVPQRSPSALADAIQNLLGDGVRRAEMGKSAAGKVRRRFAVGTCEKTFHQRVQAAIEARR